MTPLRHLRPLVELILFTGILWVLFCLRVALP